MKLLKVLLLNFHFFNSVFDFKQLTCLTNCYKYAFVEAAVTVLLRL